MYLNFRRYWQYIPNWQSDDVYNFRLAPKNGTDEKLYKRNALESPVKAQLVHIPNVTRDCLLACAGAADERPPRRTLATHAITYLYYRSTLCTCGVAILWAFVRMRLERRTSKYVKFLDPKNRAMLALRTTALTQTCFYPTAVNPKRMVMLFITV